MDDQNNLKEQNNGKENICKACGDLIDGNLNSKLKLNFLYFQIIQIVRPSKTICMPKMQLWTQMFNSKLYLLRS